MEDNSKKPFLRDAQRNGEGGSPREVSNRERTESDAAYKQFTRDKRKRIVRVERNPKPLESQDRQQPTRERRSFNPNFDEENKLRSGTAPQRPRFGDVNEKDFMHPSGRDVGFNADRTERPSRPSFNNKEYGNQRQPDRNRYDKPSGPRPERPYNDKPDYRGRPREYGNREDSRRPSSPGQGNYRGEGSREGRPYPKRNDKYTRNDNNRSPYPASKGKGGFNKPRRQAGDDNRSKGFFADGSYPTFPGGKIDGDIRLNRFISMSGICSRREADELIASGKITVNGETVTELGTKVSPNDKVLYNGRPLQGESKVYIVMNKPKGFVTSLEDPHADKTVMDLIQNTVKERVYPVGRLDKNSMGVLLITNDGELTKKLTHPSYSKKKIYQVALDKALTKADMQTLADGVTLEDGEIHADSINYVGESRKDIGIEIHSGRNRIIRRMFDHLGYTVQKLDRVYFGGLTKKNLKRGSWRFLNPREVDMLHSGKYE